MTRFFSFAVLALLSAPTVLHADPEDGPRCPQTVPAALVPAADQRLRFGLAATGAQIYVCNITAAGAYAWLFVAPQANLWNDERMVGTHFIGPTWQGNDGSAVRGARVAGATVDATAIPWLLLRSAGNVGVGRFSDISTIQRLNTTGGLAPAADLCSAATVGTIAQVPYTADYFFYDTHTPGRNPNRQCN